MGLALGPAVRDGDEVEFAPGQLPHFDLSTPMSVVQHRLRRVWHHPGAHTIHQTASFQPTLEGMSGACNAE